MMRYSAIIVAHDRPRALFATLLALRQHARPDEVLIIDNAGTVDFAGIARLSQLPARIVRIAQPGSLGVALNNGIDAAAHDQLLLMHGDTLLETDPLAAFDLLDQRSEIGIVAGKLLRGGIDPRRVLHAGYTVSRGRLAPTAIGRYEWDAYRDPVAVAGASTACMALRRTEIRFDERFWFRLEDIDFCLQYAQRGYRTLLLPDLRAVHLETGGIGERQIDPWWARRQIAAQWLYHERWCSDLPLEQHPRQSALRGQEAREYLYSVDERGPAPAG